MTEATLEDLRHEVAQADGQQQNEQKQQRLFSLTRRLIEASEKGGMTTLAHHPWDIPVGDMPMLRKRERISIYGTPYWDLATEKEKQLLAREELVTWWSGFIGLEQLVIEYYMRVINKGTFAKLPHIEDYMKHFIKEELVHTMVFKKAVAYFGSEVYPMPEFMRSFYDDNAGSGEYPLMSVYMTLLLEWMADLYQQLDVDADYVHPLAKAVVKEHWKEEMRHIKWGQNMVLGLAHTDPEFQTAVREFTPIYMRQLVDQGVTNIDCFNRVGMSHPAFQDHEALLDAVLYSEHRKQLNVELCLPMMRYFVTTGIYHPDYHDLWIDQGFGVELDMVLNKKGASA